MVNLTGFVPIVKKYLEKAIDVMLVFFLSGIFVIGICQVVWRWILKDPITWSEEAIQLIYIWVCYLGWCLAERKDAHIRITALMNALPKNVQKWLQVFNHFLCILFAVLMVVYGIKLVGIGSIRTGIAVKINMGVVYAMGPLCNLIIIFYEIAGLVECVTKGPRDYKEKGGDEE